MNDYRKAFDELSFSADFQERTADLLQQRARELEKERNNMTFGKTKKMAVLIAACVALLAVSVSAAYAWLTPAQVAEEHNQPLLAEAFSGPGAIEINETVESGDFSITLLGLVSGRNLDVLNPDLEKDHTYSVLVLRRLDGTPLENETFDFIRYTMTPLVAGYSPTAVNNWTLNAHASGFDKDGVYYYFLDTQSIEMFADRTVYMAFYEGGAPSNSIFTMADDGTIAFAEDFTGVQALFTLPLDASKADPEAAYVFVESTGLTGWSNERSGEAADAGVQTDGDGNEVITIQPGTQGSEMADPDGYWAYSDYILLVQEKLQAEVEKGVLSREAFEEAIRDMEDTLRGIAEGSVIVTVLEDGTISLDAAHGAA